MADRRVLFALAFLAVGCGDEEADPFLLDRICGNFNGFNTPCAVSGDASFSTGLTGDTLAVRLGPAGGRLDLPLFSLPAAQEAFWTLEVLVSSDDGAELIRRTITWTNNDGTCDPGICPREIPASRVVIPAGEPGWARVVDNQLGSSFAPIPFEAVVTFEGANVDILDLRTDP